MTREEAIKIIDCYDIGFYDLSGAKIPADKLADAFDMAIEALSANPSGDLIRREDAIEAVRMSEHRITIADEKGGVGTVKWDMWGVYTAEAVEALKVLPSAEAGQGWIPTKERLPNKDGYYLVCMGWNYRNMDVLMWADGWNCVRHIDGNVDRTSEIDGEDIVAWMPLPKPYKGGDKE